jgi:hypothetical protein
LLIAVGFAWLTLVGLWVVVFFKTSAEAKARGFGIGIEIPGWMPPSVGFVVIFCVLLGWALPLGIGIRTLLKSR